jgi:hypothetical protein
VKYDKYERDARAFDEAYERALTLLREESNAARVSLVEKATKHLVGSDPCSSLPRPSRLRTRQLAGCELGADRSRNTKAASLIMAGDYSTGPPAINGPPLAPSHQRGGSTNARSSSDRDSHSRFGADVPLPPQTVSGVPPRSSPCASLSRMTACTVSLSFITRRALHPRCQRGSRRGGMALGSASGASDK